MPSQYPKSARRLRWPSISLFPRETQEPPIDARTFVKFNIPLPDEIRDFYYNLEESKHTDLNRDFKAAISACKVEFVKSGGTLSVVTKDPTSQRRAGMLQEMHFRFEIIPFPPRMKLEEISRNCRDSRGIH